MELIGYTGETHTVVGKPLPITAKQPPRMSRSLHSEMFEYRSTATCPDCHQSSLRCRTCGLPLPVDTQVYCKEHGLPVEPLYVYRQEDKDGVYLRTILACLVCHAIDWWADQDYNFADRDLYLVGLRGWVLF